MSNPHPTSRKGKHWRSRITAEMAQAALVAKIMLSPEQTKELAERIILEGLTLCDEYVTGTGPQGEGTVYLPDPDGAPGELAVKRNHPAVLAYLRELARLKGTDAPTKTETKHDITDGLAERLAKAQRAVDDK